MTKRKAPTLIQATIDQALTDPRLLGAGLGPFGTWQTWGVALKAAFALPLTEAERAVFHAIAGERDLPKQRVRELWCVIGRRGGKSRMAAAIAAYLAIFGRYTLAPGECGVLLVVAASMDQAQTVLRYVVGFLEAAPILQKEIAAIRSDEVELRNGIIISVHSCSYRTIRGRTLIGCIFDEAAFWRDESTATPDTEVYTAVSPALLTTKGMLIGISTPYRKAGLLYRKHRDHFGVDGDTLVVQGASETFHPVLDAAALERERSADPTAALSELDAEFRADLNAYLDEELIDRAIDHDRPLELPPVEGVVYRAFTDTSGGGGSAGADSYTLSIVHREGDHFVTDLVRGTHGAFDPFEVTEQYAKLCREYRVALVTGDSYAKEWVATAWRKAGIEYRKCPKVKSEIYLEALAWFSRGIVRLPNHPRLIRELRLLERRTHRSGKDTIEHPRNGHDDHINAVCGGLFLLAEAIRLFQQQQGEITCPWYHSGGPKYFPGSDTFTGVGVPIDQSAPAAHYDYDRETSWKSFVNPDGSIRSRPRGGWGF